MILEFPTLQICAKLQDSDFVLPTAVTSCRAFHLGAGLTTIFSFSILCSGTSSAVTADLSGNITLPTISAQIASQNIPLLASQRHEPISLTAAVELIHSPAACLFPTTPNSRCQRRIQKANSCKHVKFLLNHSTYMLSCGGELPS